MTTKTRRIGDVRIKQTKSIETVVREQHEWECPGCSKSMSAESFPFSSLLCSICERLKEEEDAKAEQRQFFDKHPYLEGARVVGAGFSYGDLSELVLETPEGRYLGISIHHAYESIDDCLEMEFVPKDFVNLP